MRRSRKNFGAGFIVIFLGLLAVAGIVVYALSQAGARTEDFYRHRRNLGEGLFAQVQAFDPNYYPETPQAVMELFMSIQHLLYGDMIANEDIFRYVFLTMRQLYSSELLSMNDEQTQYSRLVEAVAGFRELGERIHRVDVGTVNFHPIVRDFATVSVTKHWLYTGSWRWDYYLVNEDGRWKITQWVLVD